MATVVIPDAKKRLRALGSVFIPILRELEIPDGQMIEFRFVVSLNARNMTFHRSSCELIPKPKETTKH